MVDETEKVAFNLASGLIEEIRKRLDRASTDYIAGNIERAFYSAQSVKMRIVHTLQKLNKEGKEKGSERDLLYQLEKKIARILRYVKENKRTDPKKSIAANAYVAELYVQYNELLMDMLENYGYLIHKKTDASKMDF